MQDTNDVPDLKGEFDPIDFVKTGSLPVPKSEEQVPGVEMKKSNSKDEGESNKISANQNRMPKVCSVDDLFGKVIGVERVLLIDKQKDTMVEIVEKIALVPEHKLLIVEMIPIEV